MRRFAAILLLVSACDGGTTADAGSDALRADAATPIAPPTAPALANLVPPGGCEHGWTQAAERCLPYASAPEECSGTEVHLPGTDGCAPLGECVAELAAPDIPIEGRWIYVAEGTVGGDGSLALPFGSLADALVAAEDGDGIRIGAGTFVAGYSIPRAVTIVGACAALTRIEAGESRAVLGTAARGVRISRLAMANGEFGLIAQKGAEVSVDRVAFIGLENDGIVVDGSSVSIDRILVRDDVVTADEVTSGVLVVNGGSATVTNASFVDLRRGVWVVQPGSNATVENAMSLRAPMGQASMEGSLALAWTHLSPVEGHGAHASTSGSLTLRDSVATSAILGAEMGGHVSLSRVLVRSENFTVTVRHEESTLVAEDIAIAIEGATGSGTGVFVVEGASAEVDRLTVTGPARFGLGTTPGSMLVARDVEMSGLGLEDVTSDEPMVGVLIDGSHAEIDRVRVRDSVVLAAITTSNGGSLRASDVIVSGIRFPPAALWTMGIIGEEMTLSRVHVFDVDRSGIVISGELSDVVVERILSSCDEGGACIGGIGVGAYGGWSLRMTRFRIADNGLIGVQIAEADNADGFGMMDLSNGLIERNPVGINVQDPEYDYERLLDEVSLVGNDQTIVGDTLPVPPLPAP
jgi:hypothetical protein